MTLIEICLLVIAIVVALPLIITLIVLVGLLLVAIFGLMQALFIDLKRRYFE